MPAQKIDLAEEFYHAYGTLDGFVRAQEMVTLEDFSVRMVEVLGFRFGGHVYWLRWRESEGVGCLQSVSKDSSKPLPPDAFCKPLVCLIETAIYDSELVQGRVTNCVEHYSHRSLFTIESTRMAGVSYVSVTVDATLIEPVTMREIDFKKRRVRLAAAQPPSVTARPEWPAWKKKGKS